MSEIMIGSDVHFVDEACVHLPAKVVEPYRDGSALLIVFAGNTIDEPPKLQWRTSTPYDPLGRPRSWHHGKLTCPHVHAVGITCPHSNKHAHSITNPEWIWKKDIEEDLLGKGRYPAALCGCGWWFLLSDEGLFVEHKVVKP